MTTQSHVLASLHDRKPGQMRLRTKADRPEGPLRDRIPQMGYDEMLKLCRANGLRFKERAQNQGILVMRARNALYCALRENKPLRDVES